MRHFLNGCVIKAPRGGNLLGAKYWGFTKDMLLETALWRGGKAILFGVKNQPIGSGSTAAKQEVEHKCYVGYAYNTVVVEIGTCQALRRHARHIAV